MLAFTLIKVNNDMSSMIVFFFFQPTLALLKESLRLSFWVFVIVRKKKYLNSVSEFYDDTDKDSTSLHLMSPYPQLL